MYGLFQPGFATDIALGFGRRRGTRPGFALGQRIGQRFRDMQALGNLQPTTMPYEPEMQTNRLQYWNPPPLQLNTPPPLKPQRPMRDQLAIDPEALLPMDPYVKQRGPRPSLVPDPYRKSRPRNFGGRI